MLKIYEKVREVPKTAQKTIMAGRLKGKTDINPMWRIKTLTEMFGVVGFGWYYKVLNKWLEKITVSETPEVKEVAAFVDIELYVKIDDEWSQPIFGTGGSSFVAIEKNGAYMSDECYKMALTDALSVACKALGIGADVYWSSDDSKYGAKGNQNEKAKPSKPILTPDSKQFESVIQKLKSGERVIDDVKRVFSIDNKVLDLITKAIKENVNA